MCAWEEFLSPRWWVMYSFLGQPASWSDFTWMGLSFCMARLLQRVWEHGGVYFLFLRAARGELRPLLCCVVSTASG